MAIPDRKRQTLLTDFFRRHTDGRCVKAKPTAPQLSAEFPKLGGAKRVLSQSMNAVVARFRRAYEKNHPDQKHIFSRQGICYYEDSDRTHYEAYAASTGDSVGVMELDNGDFLFDIEVVCKRQGIGETLVRAASQSRSNGIMVCINPAVNSSYRLTDEGRAFINRCVAKGIIKEEQLIFSPVSSPSSRWTS